MFGKKKRKKYTFEILEINESILTIDQRISAKCVETGIVVGILVGNSQIDDKRYIRNRLINKHKEILDKQKREQNSIKVGEVV